MGPAEISFAVLLVLVAAVSFLYVRLTEVEKRLSTMSVISAKLDVLLRQAGVDFNPHEHVPPEVVEALERDDKIEAIKNYRAATGVGLKEAKEFVEEVQKQLKQE